MAGVLMPSECAIAFFDTRGLSPSARDNRPKGGILLRADEGVNCGKRLLTISVFLGMKTGTEAWKKST
jgi:hypothetical protein